VVRKLPSPGETNAARLRRAALRATAPRLAVLSLLAGERRHPTAEQIHAALRGAHPSLSLSTVYGILEVFARAGLCRRLFGGGGLLRVDGMLEEHDHAVCRVCDRIFDVDRGRLAVPSPPASLPGGFRVAGVRFEYDVICPKCGPGAARSSGAEKTLRGKPAAGRGRPPTSKRKETARWRNSKAPRRTGT
jgi:Fur family peroxide stress response transcriptional regulator